MQSKLAICCIKQSDLFEVRSRKDRQSRKRLEDDFEGESEKNRNNDPSIADRRIDAQTPPAQAKRI
jgi:hypothetical protein